MNSQYFAFLDIGGTDLKSALVEVGNIKLESISRRPIPPFISLDSFCKEVDPGALINTCNELLQGMIGRQRRFAGLLISGQMGGWLLSDEKNEPITNLISWQDLRSEQKAVDGRTMYVVAAELFGKEWIKESGNEMRAGLPVIGLFEYLTSHGWKGGAMRFHSFISWVAAALSTDYVFSVHPTDIASSGLYNIYQRTFSQKVLALLNDELSMPSVQDGLHIVGYCKMLNCPIYCAVGDQQASLFGAGLEEESTVVNIGTGGQVAKLADNIFQEFAQIRPYFNNRFIVTKTHLPSGRALRAFLELLRSKSVNDDDYEWMSREAIETEPGLSRDVVNFEMEILRLRSEVKVETAETIASSVIQGIVQKYVTALRLVGHRDGDPLIFAGGVGQKMKALPILIGKEMKSEVVISNTAETTLQGLANLSSIL